MWRRAAHKSRARGRDSVANTFEIQANDRFKKSDDFLYKANSLIHDDLMYRSALEDAVSAIKNMLQGYLLRRVAASPSDPRSQEWQEIVGKGEMPKLLKACADAGLDLHGRAEDISFMNRKRNQRAHDGPQFHIDPRFARDAVVLAGNVKAWINSALADKQGKSATVPAQQAAAARPPVPVPAAATAATAATAKPATQPVTSPNTPLHPSGAAAPVPTPAAPPLDDALPDEDSDDDADIELPTRVRRRGRVRRIIVNVLAALLLLVVGAAAGIGLVLPVASANAPDLLAPVVKLLPTPVASAPTATPLPTATPTLSVSGPQTLGSLAIGAPTCAAGTSSVLLTNNGTTAARWAVGSVDVSGARFALTQANAGAGAQFGTLAAGKNATLYITNPGGAAPYSIILTSDAGAVQVVVGAC